CSRIVLISFQPQIPFIDSTCRLVRLGLIAGYDLKTLCVALHADDAQPRSDHGLDRSLEVCLAEWGRATGHQRASNRWRQDFRSPRRSSSRLVAGSALNG